MLVNATFLKRRKRWLLCMVVAAIECLSIPVGTVLGFFTIVVLLRDSVKKMFGYCPSAALPEDQTPPL